MFWCSPAASADDVRAKIFCEMLDLRCKTLGCFVVLLLAVFNFRQTCVRQNRNRQRRVLAKIAKTVSHLFRTGAAVHSDNIDREWLERREGGAELGSALHSHDTFARG